MAIFPARRIGILPRKRARPACGTAAAVASAGASWAEYGIFTFGPSFAQALAQVEVEEIAGWTTNVSSAQSKTVRSCRFLEGAALTPQAAGYRPPTLLRAVRLAQPARRSSHAQWASAERF